MGRATEGPAGTRGDGSSGLTRAAYLAGGVATSALAAALVLLISGAMPGGWLGPKIVPILAYGIVTLAVLFPPPSEIDNILGVRVGARNSIAFSVGWALVLVAAFYAWAFSAMP